MVEKKLNNRLNIAKAGKKDEFYTQITDIEKELGNYRQHFKDKVVFCNCDDPAESNFWRFFSLNFEQLGLKKLISTHYHDEKSTYKLEITKDVNGDGKVNQLDTVKTKLTQNGDFRSPECVEILKEADIVVTNPPFSLFREYVAQLISYEKKFLILGSQSAITYKETFQLIRDNKIWTGVDCGGTKWFQVPDDYEIKTENRKKIIDGVKYFSLGNVYWFTNLDNKKRHEDLVLYKKYSPEEYVKYDNYDAINVNKVAEIPFDYEGVMGVPVTFVSKYNPDQFEIVGLIAGNIKGMAGIESSTGKDGPYIDGKLKYGRVLIRFK